MDADAGPRRMLWDPLGDSRKSGALLELWENDRWTTWSWDEWRSRAFRFAGGLRELGVRPGDRVACQLSNSPACCAAVLGTWLAGGCLVSIPGIARGVSWERYFTQVHRIVTQAEPNVLLAHRSFTEAFRGARRGLRVVAVEAVDGPAIAEPLLAGEHEPVFVQYSSGSTSDPRGCVLSARAIAHQLTMLEAALQFDPESDVSVNWLPLSHDMGLFGCLLLTAYWADTRLVLGTPERFLTSPQSWFADCAAFGASTAAGPNFALELTARVARMLPPHTRAMSRVILGGERVEARTLERALEALGPLRLPRHALMPAYGLAEAVLAVTMTSTEKEPTVLTVDREALARGQVRTIEPDARSNSEAMSVVSAGLPLPGNEVEILGEAEVGEIRVRSDSLAEGYLTSSGSDRQRFTSKGLMTGDIGFLREGELYVTGRIDDLLIVAGRNVLASDIEVALLESGLSRPGSCAVVQAGDGPERLVAVLEPVDNHPDFSVMAVQLRQAARQVAGVRLDECVFLPRGHFPKTPSGKTQRFRCREIAGERSLPAGTRIAF